jgi:hypothetical protein
VGAQAKKQLLAIAVALALWAFAGHPAFWAFVVAYVAAVALLCAVGAQRLLGKLPASAEALLLLVIAAPGAAWLVRARAGILETEGLKALPFVIGERARLEALPAIAPPLLSADRPQTFFVHANAHARVGVRFGPSAQTLAAEELGEGLYRVEYDPRRGATLLPKDGPLRVGISVDGREVERTLQAVTPLAHPRWLATSFDRKLAATVSEETDELVIVSERGIERRVPVDDGPSDCAFVGAHQIAVSHRDSAELLVIDADNGARIKTVTVGERQGRLALSPDRKLLAVARTGHSGEIVLLDVASFRTRERIALEVEPDWIAFGADADTLIASTRTSARLLRLRRLDGVWRADGEIVLGRRAVTLGRSLDGSHIFVAVTDYRPDGSANLANHFIQDQILTIDVARFQVVSVQLTARRSARQSKPGDVDRGVSPMGIVQSQDGALLVTFAGTDELWRMHAGKPEPEIIDLSTTALNAPHGIAEIEHGTLIVTSPASGAIGLLASFEHKPRILRLAPDDDYLRLHNREALARRIGERGFYEATRSGISCQSCHMHADSDEGGHNLGMHKLLPTLSVRGLYGTAPYLRDGSFARVADLDHVSQTLYRGYLRRTAGRAQTLDAFVAALPRTPNPHSALERDPPRERRGLQAFVQAACPTCHALPAFTNLGPQLLVNVFPQRRRTAAADDVLDTPSLLSIGASAPYLSDGSAHTLEALLFEMNRSNHHGDTARLSHRERDDLIAFLESL